MKIENVEKLVANLHDKENYVMHIRNLKQALNHGLVLKKVHRTINTRNLKQALNHGLVLKKVQRIIKFNQRDWKKPYIDMNTDLRKKEKNDFENDFFNLINNAISQRTMENVRKHKDIKLVTIEARNEKRNRNETNSGTHK